MGKLRSRFENGLSNLRGSALLRAIISVASGSAIAQAIVLCFAPLITRIYTPEIFGVQGIFLAAVSLLTPIVALRYPMAIVVAEGDREVRSLELLSYSLTAVLAAILAIITILFGESFAAILGFGATGHLIYLLPIALMLVAFQEVAKYRAARQRQFRLMGVSSVVQAFVTNGAKTLVGLAAPVSASLVVVSTLSPGLQALILSRGSRRRHPRRPGRPNGSMVRKVGIKHRNFALLRMPTDLLNAASQTAPVLLLSVFFGPVAAGLYTLTRSVLSVPSNLFGNAVGTVYYSHFADLARRREDLTRELVRSTLTLLLGPGLLIIAVSLFAPYIFELVFGENWRQAGEYARWLSLWTAVALANVPSVRMAPVINRQGALLVANIGMLLSRVAAILGGYFATGDELATVAVFALVSAVGNACATAWLIALTKRYDRCPSKASFNGNTQHGSSGESTDDE